MAPHIYGFSCTRTGSRHWPWHSLVLYLGGTIWDQWALDSAIGTGFYKFLSVFAKLYPPHMPQFYMPTISKHQNNSKIALFNFNLVWSPLGKPPGFGGSIAIFSAVDMRHGDTGYPSLFLIITGMTASLVSLCSPTGHVMGFERV